MISLTSDAQSVLEVNEMNNVSKAQERSCDDQLLMQLAAELQRLATSIKRDLQRNALLPGLSGLTAMRPLQAMLVEALTAKVGRPESDSTDATSPESTVPGYL